MPGFQITQHDADLMNKRPPALVTYFDCVE